MNKDVELIELSEGCTEHASLTFIDFFSGIGGFHSGFEKAGMKCVGWCEFDKFAQKSYRTMYNTERLWFSDDIRKARGWELPNATIWTFGFPCQDISIAGKQKGIRRGTRSGLFFEIMRLIDECEDNKPQWLVCENVRNLLSIEGGRGMLAVLSEMDKRGYDAEWKIYNSKNYGVPQNRERVYIAGHLRDGSATELLPIPRENSATIKQIGNIIDTHSFGGNPQRGRVYSDNGISPTLNTCQGGDLETKVLTRGYRRDNNAVDVSGISGTILARDYKDALKIATNTKRGYVMAKNGDGVDLSYPNSQSRRGRVKSGATNTLTTQSTIGVVLQDGSHLTIRKMTPREYWRLQGFTDEQYEKAQDVNSNSQLYKQAGNAVTVNVTYEIGKHIVELENRR